jgi:hypothetical protein
MKFKARVWIYPGESANWHFISLPKQEAAFIEKKYSQHKKGWGSLPVEVKVGKTSWKTSIFPDKRSGTYLLPLKAAVRKYEDIEAEEEITISLKVLA